MKYLILLTVIVLAGCSSEIESRHITAGQFLCFDQDGISDIILDPIGSDLYICNDGSQFVVGYSQHNGESYYYIKHNSKDKKSNDFLDKILMPKKWAEKGVVVKHKDIERIMKPVTEMVGEMGDRGL